MARDLPPLPASPAFLDAMLARWRADPGSVDRQWHELFMDLGETPGPNGTGAAPANGAPSGDPRGLSLLRAYRERGHLIARADPLGLADQESHPDLDPAAHGLASGDEAIDMGGTLGLGGTTAAALETRLKAVYCGTLSAEFMHLDDPAPRAFLQYALEHGHGIPETDDRRAILDRILEVETFEEVMQAKFPTAKRFGMEGSESQLPLCETLLAEAARAGADEIVVGPMHRGRTTFMATFMRKPLEAVFAEFAGRPWHAEEVDMPGDVTYHMGHTAQRRAGSRTVRLSMASHPSHVETQIAVALGRTRARQALAGDEERARVLGLMMHTDAGFAGQGIIAECFQLSGLEGYRTGGSIHVVANNQVGFTTRPRDARTSRYCTDMGRIVQAPVLRVNGDDPEAAHRAAVIAVAFWQRFHRDIIIDLVCYRRRGHNELDEPRYTHGPLYAAIDAHPGVCRTYGEALTSEGVVDAMWIESRKSAHRDRFLEAHEASAAYRPNAPAAKTGKAARAAETGVDPAALRALGERLHALPEGFAVHPNLARQLAQRAETVASGRGIAWATAELLAFASLLAEGRSVRLTGEDTRRGTFSQRHAMVLDQETGAAHVPLENIASAGARFEVHDTPLSEEAVLGFEYGLSLEAEDTLTCWEAQFGDFANVAQSLIDNYLANGADKWDARSGLVLLLPHGLEGGGPEHSSARIERFLQLCARDNLRVVNCTTPSNHFHALRRQALDADRRPLVAMTPKLMLRHRDAVSDIEAFAPGTRFEPVLSDLNGSRKKRARIVISSGRIGIVLDEARRTGKRDDVALVRIEELYPFPAEMLAKILKPHRDAEIVWCQEEPRNMGAWSFIDRRLEAVLNEVGHARPTVRYAGRPEATVPAAPTRAAYEREQQAVIGAAFSP